MISAASTSPTRGPRIARTSSSDNSASENVSLFCVPPQARAVAAPCKASARLGHDRHHGRSKPRGHGEKSLSRLERTGIGIEAIGLQYEGAARRLVLLGREVAGRLQPMRVAHAFGHVALDI